MYCVHLYCLHVYCALVNLDSSGSPGVCPTPGLTSSTRVVCVYVRAYTSTHTHPTLTLSQVTYRGQGDTGHNQRHVMKVRTRTSEKAEN